MLKNKMLIKVISFFLLMTMLFSISQPILAVSGTGSWVGGQYDTKMKTTDNVNKSTGVLARRLVNNSTGEKRTVFCAEHGVSFKTGVAYNGKYYTPTDPKVKKACKIAYLGWYKNYPYYVIDGGILANEMKWVKWDYVCTQQYIWEVLGQSSATFIDSKQQEYYEDFKNRINNELNNFAKRPSFDATTITIQAGETKTITDTNGVLSDYASLNKTQDGITFKHNNGENTMTISVDENTSIENYRVSDYTFKSWGMIKNSTKDEGSMVYFEFADGLQNQLMSFAYNDPLPMTLSLKIDLFGKLELSKLDTTGKLVNGAKYRVTGNNYDRIFEVTNGKIIVDKLKKGNYKVTEVEAPKGYLINTKVYNVTITPNQTTTQAITNTEPTGTISLTKTDVKTGNRNRIDVTTHHGDASLDGAVYTLYANEDINNVSKSVKYFSKNEEIATFKFDANGKATIHVVAKSNKIQLNVNGQKLENLPIGTYIAKETTTPTGYKKDENTYTYDLKYKDQNTKVIAQDKTANEDVQRAKFEIIKISSNNNSTATKIANAEFTAILSRYVKKYGSFTEAQKHLNEFADDEYSVFKTNSEGHGISSLLAYGEYEVRETSVPSDEILEVDPFYVTIDRNSDGIIKELVENDLPFESYLKMVKIDKGTGKKVTFSNATFKLYRLNDKNEWEKVKCKTGLISHATWKTDENGIAVTETKLQSGTYKIEEIKTPKGYLQHEGEITFKINRSNNTLEYDEDYDAYITIKVDNEKPTGIINLNKTISFDKNADLSLVDTSDLSKIEFTLYAKDKIIEYRDGSTIYNKGQEIGKYNLTKDGKLKIEKLPMGTYELKETKTLDGLATLKNPIEVKFEKKDDTARVYTKDIKVTNEITKISISKTDITGDKELEGAKLQVIDKNNKVIDEWTSTNKAHLIEGLKVNEEYTLREIIAPNGFVKATDIKFKVSDTGEVQKINMKDKIVEVSKTDITGDKELEGAELQVTNENGEVVDKWTSGKEEHIVNGLEEGKKYTLTEITCPYGYKQAESVTFKVDSNKEIQRIVMKDAPIHKNIKVQKIDSETKDVIKDTFKFGIYSDENCNNLMKEVTSNKDEGIAEFNELRYGTYYIKETKAPKGYELSNRIAKVEINDKGIFVDGNQVEESNDTITFNFGNKKIEVPKTGDNSHLRLALGIIILATLGIAYIFIHKHNKDKNNK